MSGSTTTSAVGSASRDAAHGRFRASVEAPGAFFDARAADLGRACLDLASAFHRGHRLLVVGTAAQASDALHVSVEFVHPVIVGKRALPALAITDAPADWLRPLAEAGDVVLGLSHGGSSVEDAAVREALAVAGERGCLRIAMVARDVEGWDAEHVFAVDSPDPFVVQEVQETAYHVLWELVHVFLDHPEMLS